MFKEIEEITKNRRAARRKLEELAQKLYDISVQNNIKIAGTERRVKYSTAYSGCYERHLFVEDFDPYEWAEIDNMHSLFCGSKINKICLLNEKDNYYHSVEYSCNNPYIADTKMCKEWINRQILNIKEYKNFEEEYLKEIINLCEN